MNTNIVVLDNIRSAYNVGSILRTADAAGISRVIAAGITPHLRTPSDTRPAHVITKTEQLLAKTALGAERSLQFDYHATLAQAISELKTVGYAIYALEQALSSQNVLLFTPSAPWALIVGHERDGVQELDQVDAVLEIPMRGHKESLNVSVAAGIALYYMLNR